MTDISPAVWQQFYDPLVGTPERMQQLQAHLAANATDATAGQSPYERVEQAMTEALLVSIDLLHGSGIPSTTRDKLALLENGLTGTELSLTVLKGLGNVYKKKAQEPQDQAMVRRNTRSALLGMYGVAQLDTIKGVRQVGMLTSGRKGAGTLRTLYYLHKFRESKEFKTKRRAFVVKDKDGQLDISLRVKPTSPTPGASRCPAVDHRTEHDGRKRASLLLLMGVIGDAVNTAIYPELFAIENGREA